MLSIHTKSLVLLLSLQIAIPMQGMQSLAQKVHTNIKKSWYKNPKILLGIGVAAIVIIIAAYGGVKRFDDYQRKLQRQAQAEDNLLWDIRSQLASAFSLDNLIEIEQQKAQDDPVFFRKHNIDQLIQNRWDELTTIADDLAQKVNAAQTQQDFNYLERDPVFKSYLDANQSFKDSYEGIKQMQISRQGITTLLGK